MEAAETSTYIVENYQGSVDTSNGVVAYPGLDRGHARVHYLGRHACKKDPTLQASPECWSKQ